MQWNRLLVNFFPSPPVIILSLSKVHFTVLLLVAECVNRLFLEALWEQMQHMQPVQSGELLTS